MKRLLFVNWLLVAGLVAFAQTRTDIRQMNHAGPYAVSAPFGVDSVDVQGKKFDPKSLLDAISLSAPAAQKFEGAVLPSLQDSRSVGLFTFYINNKDYLKGKLRVKGPKNYKLFVDGKDASEELKLTPEHHSIAIKYLAEPKDTDSIRVYIDAPRAVAYTLDKRHPYMPHDLLDGRRVRSAALSADGSYLTVAYQTVERGGKSRWTYELLDARTLRLVSLLPDRVKWMPRSVAYIAEESENGRRMLYRVNPATGARSLFASDVPEGSYEISPTEDYLILHCEAEGPKEDPAVFEVLEMDDRQPGWRKRTYLCKYDIATGVCQRITYGTKGEYLQDISADGRKLLVGSSYSRLAKRPTEVADLFVIDVQTLKADTLLVCEGFLGGAWLSPDATQVLIKGTPEAFDRIGCQLPASVTPSMTEGELFLMDIATKKVTPLTKDFDPSIDRTSWSVADGNVYFTAEERDYVNMYALNPKTGTIVQLPVEGDNVFQMSLASHAPVMTYLSGKVLEPVSAYVMNIAAMKALGSPKKLRLANLTSKVVFDGSTVISDTEVGTCEDWNFTNSRGETVYGRLYLPTDFDATKKYPMIVNYYGGCSPTSRYFESRYPAQYWTSLGYAVYVVQPSGATGFGQEWASRHVNTAGRGPAEDIIEGTKKICEAHPFLNAAKVGCIGASYGGFMTMYLQTITDIFAAAISHAGIANHTSYWGEGYWGYNYSEVSMANSYPWSHRELYVDQSPLFNADKIHTPLLLLHGNGDTNVPLIESLQMFTALKLLGREVALVEVEGENHHILEYTKRQKWMATQMAWFAKWLKDDPTWWDALYPKKHL